VVEVDKAADWRWTRN